MYHKRKHSTKPAATMVRMLKLTQRDFKITMINTLENPAGKGGHHRGSSGDVPWGGGHPPHSLAEANSPCWPKTLSLTTASDHLAWRV